jgi:hypothetical protein
MPLFAVVRAKRRSLVITQRIFASLRTPGDSGHRPRRAGASLCRHGRGRQPAQAPGGRWQASRRPGQGKPGDKPGRNMRAARGRWGCWKSAPCRRPKGSRTLCVAWRDARARTQGGVASGRRVLGQRRADGVIGGGGDGDTDHALTATFRHFVGFRSRASRCASAIWAGVSLAPPAASAE